MSLHPEHTYVHLAPDGSSTAVRAADFWSQPDSAPGHGDGWLVTEFEFSEDWANWEMHPQGDEFVYLLAGALELHIERNGTIEIIALEGRAAQVIPRGLWHTAKVKSPSRMLHVTRGEGTQHRPA